MARRLAAIQFTDIAGHTSLSQTDERTVLELLHEQERPFRPLLEIHRGRLAKSMGDGPLIDSAFKTLLTDPRFQKFLQKFEWPLNR